MILWFHIMFSAGFVFDMVQPENLGGIAQFGSFYHQSDLESGLFIFSNWWGWLYIPSVIFLHYSFCGDDCSMWGWGLGKYGKYHSEPMLLRETNVTRPFWLQSLHWKPLYSPRQEQGIGTGAVRYVPDTELFRTSLHFLFLSALAANPLNQNDLCFCS